MDLGQNWILLKAQNVLETLQKNTMCIQTYQQHVSSTHPQRPTRNHTFLPFSLSQSLHTAKHQVHELGTGPGDLDMYQVPLQCSQRKQTRGHAPGDIGLTPYEVLVHRARVYAGINAETSSSCLPTHTMTNFVQGMQLGIHPKSSKLIVKRCAGLIAVRFDKNVQRIRQFESFPGPDEHVMLVDAPHELIDLLSAFGLSICLKEHIYNICFTLGTPGKNIRDGMLKKT